MNNIPAYFASIDKEVASSYQAAESARKQGYDPEPNVGIPLAKNMAERVEGLIGAAIPQIINSGLSKRIQELESQYGKLDWRVGLSISLEVTQGTFCKFDNEVKAIEAGIRVGIAYLTLGVVASPLEGFVELKIKKRRDGKNYFCLMYAGPIRSAGGTAGGFSVILADYLRNKLGYATYDPTDEEINRSVTELYDYHDRVTNLQYLPSEEEIRFLASKLPLQVDGDASEKIEVSNYKGLDRIETNKIRSGHCLVMGECLAQKAKKLWNNVSKWAHDFDLQHWSWMDEFLDVQKKAKSQSTSSDTKISPVLTYIQDLVAGRPVLTHPLAAGGFRLRYGRSRASGYSATAIHPATMHVLNRYLATGTQLKVERPGKATAITVCDSIEGPIVKLKDGSVIRVSSEAEAKHVAPDIAQILFLGDILINYGDFFNRAHTLVPPGYCEEWWKLELQKAAQAKFGTDFVSDLANELLVDTQTLQDLLDNPLIVIPTAPLSFLISKKLSIPLHPHYTYHWKTISYINAKELITTIQASPTISEEKIVLPYSDNISATLDQLGIPHLLSQKEFLVIEKGDAFTLFTLSAQTFSGSEHADGLAYINQQDALTLRDKSGVFIGARMGRPEKAKMRKLTGSPHTLFPVGDEGGRLRSFQAALEKGRITAEFPSYYCATCAQDTIFSICEQCSQPTKEKPVITGYGPQTYERKTIDINRLFRASLKKIGMTAYPDLIKGVRGTSNKSHKPEHLIKGILRARHDIYVNKDGTTRYDMTQLPITHFKPREIGTSIERLKELGYEKDKDGKEVTSTDQVLELFPQDIILPACDESPETGAETVMFNTTRYVDSLLTLLYGQKPYYNFSSPKDLPGALVMVLAPHTSAAVVGRVIGFSKTQGFLTNPLFHAATRRDCDGDEASFTLLMDGLLNFSKQFLPNTRGATQDASLVLTSRLIPAEVDDMIFDMDVTWEYSLEFYEACLMYKNPYEVSIEQFGKRLETEKQYYDFGFTHPVSDINGGVRCSAYKILPSMQEKLQGQMDLAEKIRAVDEADVARLVIEKHLIRDIKGNMRKFSMQQFRCVACNEKFRRPPLIGRCTKCNGKIIFTISEGSIVKYLEPAISLADKYNLPAYLKQNLELTKRNLESLFGREKEQQLGLGKWF